MAFKMTVSHNGTDYYGQVATIKSTTLGQEDHGILTAYLHVEGDGWGTGVGGYGLDSYSEAIKERVPTAYGLDQLVQMMRTVGVSRWEDLPGKRVVVLYKTEHPLGSIADGIANIDTGAALILKEHAQAWLGEEVSS